MLTPPCPSYAYQGVHFILVIIYKILPGRNHVEPLAVKNQAVIYKQ